MEQAVKDGKRHVQGTSVIALAVEMRHLWPSSGSTCGHQAAIARAQHSKLPTKVLQKLVRLSKRTTAGADGHPAVSSRYPYPLCNHVSLYSRT